MTRNDIPLNEVDLHDSIDTGLASSRSFIELQALRLWGASLNDLRAWKGGDLDKSLMDLAVYFYLGHVMFENHKQDVLAIEQHNRAQKAKSKK